MAYTKTNWQDTPSIATPINATNLNKIETGLFDQDAAITALDTRVGNLEQYLTATAGANGDFHVTIPNGVNVAANDIVRISFPAATTATANARLSLNGSSGTFRNIYRKVGTSLFQFTAVGVQNSRLDLLYDGTQFLIMGGLEKEVFLTALVSVSAGGTITLNQPIDHFDYVMVATGNVTNGGLRTEMARGWFGSGFRAGTDFINVTTNSGKCVIAITTTTTLTVSSTNDSVRYIIGCRH